MRTSIRSAANPTTKQPRFGSAVKMGDNKSQGDQSLLSIDEKISFFEQQKNRIKDSLPGSGTGMVGIQEGKLESTTPEVSENTSTEELHEESYSVHLRKDDNGSLGLKIAKRGNATYVIGFTSDVNPEVTIGDQLIRVGVHSVDGKPLGEIARIMRAAISPVSVTLKPLKGNKKLVSQVLSLQSAKLKMRNALRRATAMGLVSEALSSRSNGKLNMAKKNNKLQENITPSQGEKYTSTPNASDSLVDTKDDHESSESSNDRPIPTQSTAVPPEDPPVVLQIKEQNEKESSITSDGAHGRSNNPFSSIPGVDEELVSATIDEEASAAKRPSPISQELSIEKWPSPINFTMKSIVSNENTELYKDDPSKDKIIALELEIQRLNKLQTKTLVAHDVELARFQHRIDDANSMLNDAKGMHISYKQEVEDARKESKEKEMELKLCKIKCERIEKENQALHEKLIQAQQAQAETKEELQRLRILHNEFRNEHQKLVHFLNRYRDTIMNNQTKNAPPAVSSVARRETPRLHHREILFEALTVPESNGMFSPGRYSPDSHALSTLVSKSKITPMMLQDEEKEPTTDINALNKQPTLYNGDNWY